MAEHFEAKIHRKRPNKDKIRKPQARILQTMSRKMNKLCHLNLKNQIKMTLSTLMT